MNSQKGFISTGLLIAIILGIVVIGGGAYYMGHQNAAPQTPAYQDQTNTLPTTQTTTQTPNKAAQVLAPQQKQPTANTSVRASATLDKNSLMTSSASPTITGTASSVGSLIVQVVNPNGGAMIYQSSPIVPVNGRWSVSATLSNLHSYLVLVFGYANTDGTNPIDVDGALTSGTLTITQTSGPSATIDQSSLVSATTPILSGTISGTSDIIVAVWQGNLSPSEMNYSTNSKLQRWASNTQIRNPEVSVSGGRWSTNIGNSEVAGLGGPIPYFPNGTYSVSVSDASTGKILTTGTLQITGPSIEVTHADTSTVSVQYVGLPANSQILLAGQSSNPPVVATVSGTGSISFTIPGGLDGTYWLQVQLSGSTANILQSGPFSANYVGR